MASSYFSHTPVDVEYINTKYRKIYTPIPVPESLPLLEKMYLLAKGVHLLNKLDFTVQSCAVCQSDSPYFSGLTSNPNRHLLIRSPWWAL